MVNGNIVVGHAIEIFVKNCDPIKNTLSLLTHWSKIFYGYSDEVTSNSNKVAS